jgi:hypothetical protein
MGEHYVMEKFMESMHRMMVQLLEQAQSRSSSSFDGLKNLEANIVRLASHGDFFRVSRDAIFIFESQGMK